MQLEDVLAEAERSREPLVALAQALVALAKTNRVERQRALAACIRGRASVVERAKIFSRARVSRSSRAASAPALEQRGALVADDDTT
jgi:hypothetical protein